MMLMNAPRCANPTCLHLRIYHYPPDDIAVVGSKKLGIRPRPALVGQCASRECPCAAFLGRAVVPTSAQPSNVPSASPSSSAPDKVGSDDE